MSKPTILQVSSHITVIGDIHGQFQDLQEIFLQCGYPPDVSYLFIGDYVDRGLNSVECILTLFLLKKISNINKFSNEYNNCIFVYFFTLLFLLIYFYRIPIKANDYVTVL